MDTKKSNSKVIFIIDDELQYLEVLSEALKKYNANLEILTYDNGYMAMKDLSNHQPDLIILDNDMPAISGLEICRQFSSYLKNKNLLISTSNVNVIDDFKKIGINNFLTKPFPLKNLINIINQI